jgi:hypothetical protein
MVAALNITSQGFQGSEAASLQRREHPPHIQFPMDAANAMQLGSRDVRSLSMHCDFNKSSDCISRPVSPGFMLVVTGHALNIGGYDDYELAVSFFCFLEF